MVGSAIRNLTAVVQLSDRISGPLVRINRGLDGAKVNMRSLGAVIQKNSMGFMALGAALTGLSAAIALPLKAAVSGFADFEEAMANVSTMVDTTTENMSVMGNQVLNLSKIIPVSATEMAKALYEVRSAGVDSANAMSFLDVSARTAVAGVTDTTTAANALSGVIKGYGMDFSEAQNISDKLFKTVQLGKTNFEQLGVSILGVVPNAKAMGVEVNELLAGFATLTGVTGNTAEVSTQLDSILSGFIKPTDKLTKTVKGLGFATSKEMISELGLIGTLKELMATTDGSNEALGELFARKEAITAILALLGPQYDDFIMKQGEMTDSAGAMEEAYRKNAATFKASMQRMSNSIFAFKTSIGAALAPAIRRVAGGISKLTGLLSGLPKPLIALTASFAALTAVVAGIGGPLLLMAGGLAMVWQPLMLAISGMGGLTGAIGLATGAVSTFLGTVLSLAPWLLAIAGAVIVFQHIWKKNLWGVQEATSKVFAGIKKIVGVTFKVLKEVFSGLAISIAIVTMPLLRWLGFMNKVGRENKAFVEIVDAIGGAFRGLYKLIQPHIPLIKNLLKFLGMIGGVILMLKGAMLAIAGALVIFKGALLAVSGVILLAKGVMLAIGAAVALITSPIGLVILALGALYLAFKHFDVIKNVVGGAVDWVGSKLSGILRPLMMLFPPIAAVVLAFKHWSEIKEIIGGVVDFAAAKIQWLVDIISGALDSIRSLTDIGGIVKGLAGGLMPKLGLPKIPSLEIATPRGLLPRMPSPSELVASTTSMSQSTTKIDQSRRIDIKPGAIVIKGVSDPEKAADLTIKKIERLFTEM